MRKVLGDKRYLDLYRTLSCDTMKVHWIVLLVLIGAALFAPAVSAQIGKEKDRYIVSPAYDVGKANQFARVSALASNTISQGQLHTYSRSVSSGTTSIVYDLNWGDTSDSLSLGIVAPDATLGPYYDNIDGQTDGRIFISVSRSSGLAPGTWSSGVYGYQVTGSEDYTFTSY